MKHTVISMAMCAILAVPSYAQRGNVNGRMPDVIGQAVSIAGGLDVLATNGCYQKTGGPVSGLITANGGLTATGSASFATSGGNVGIGTTAPSGKLHVSDSSSTNVALFERSGQTANSSFVGARVLATKTTDMADGFGSAISFNIQDNAGGINSIALIGAVRAGADSTGDIVFRPAVAGVSDEKMRITGDGNVGIGTTNPVAKAHINGNLRVEDAQTNAGALVVQGVTTLTNTTVNGNMSVYGWRGDPIYYEDGTLTGTNVFWRWVFVGGSINSNSLQMICATNPVTYPTPQTGTTNAFYIAPATL